YAVVFEIDFLVLVGRKHPEAREYQQRPEYVQYPFKTFYQFYAHRNKNNAQQDGHKYTNEQHAGIVLLFDTKESKNKYEYEDIVDTQAPFHEVGTDVLDTGFVAILVGNEYSEGKGEQHPEN